MEIYLGVIAGIIIICGALIVLFEYRIRQPDTLVLYESKGYISFRDGLLFPRHFSLQLKRTTYPIQLNILATAEGNLEVNVKLVGSVAPSVDHIQSLIRVGGWHVDAVAQAADEAQVLMEGLIKEFTERSEIHVLTSTGILSYLNEQSTLLEEELGLELVSIAVQSLEPTDLEVADALRQREKARLIEQTEQLNHQARTQAANAKFQADEEIAALNHAVELKKVALKKQLLEEESALAQKRLEDELERSRMRLAFEKEEVEVLKNSPELLMLTPQAARLAEASQNLKSARTVISLTPHELEHGSELLSLFQSLLQKALEGKKET